MNGTEKRNKNFYLWNAFENGDERMKLEQIGKIVVEFWKLAQSYERSIPLLPPEHQARTQAQLRFSRNQLKTLLDESRMTLVTFEGRVFQPNLPVTAVNAEDFDEGSDHLIVDQTIEPAVVHDAHVLLMGKVLLAKGKKDVLGN